MKKISLKQQCRVLALQNSCVGILFFCIVGIYVLAVAFWMGDVLSRLLSAILTPLQT
jgi:hypothetical protein